MSKNSAGTSAAPESVAEKNSPVTEKQILLCGEAIVKDFPVKKALFTGKVLKTFRAVDHVSLSLSAGETLGIVGESGSGKSTVSEILGGLQLPTEGTVTYRGRDIHKMDREQYRGFRRNVQFIFQDPKGSMNPNASILEILTEPLITLNIEADPEKRAAKAAALCESVGLEQAVLGKRPGALSGGQCQRLVIARALITEPEIIICDEAVSALDVSIQAQILNLLKDLQDRTGVAYLFISHDIGVVSFMADRIAVMKSGQVVETGTAAEVLSQPKAEYTKNLLACSFAKRA